MRKSERAELDKLAEARRSAGAEFSVECKRIQDRGALGYVGSVVGEKPESALIAQAKIASDWLQLQVTMMKHQDAYVDHLAALSREADRQNRCIQKTLVVLTAALTIATIISLFKH